MNLILKELPAVFRPRQEHQSYPVRLHGVIIATILDEAIGRAIMRYGVFHYGNGRACC